MGGGSRNDTISTLWLIIFGSSIIVFALALTFALPDGVKEPDLPPACDSGSSKPNGVFSRLLGWVYFLAWSYSFWPQIYINFRNKTVRGLSLDFQALNFMAFICYSVFNIFFYYDTTVQNEYCKKNNGNPNLVQANDVFFALHGVFATGCTLIQFIVWPEEREKISWASILTIIWVILSSAGFILITQFTSWSFFSFLNFLYYLSVVKLVVTAVKYAPQVYLNHKRKSTQGWSIYNIILDFTGGWLSTLQLFLDSMAQHDWSGMTGDPVKFGLGLVSIVYDIIFMLQHYCLYSKQDEYSLMRASQSGSIQHPPRPSNASSDILRL